jgi:hypothetical protein
LTWADDGVVYEAKVLSRMFSPQMRGMDEKEVVADPRCLRKIFALSDLEQRHVG